MKDSPVSIPISFVREGAITPKYAHDDDAGMDIFAAQDILLLPGETKLIPTGFAMALPDGYEAQIRPRSGISLKTMLRVPNSPGTIDAGFRDEVCVILHNASVSNTTNELLYVSESKNRHGTYQIQAGDRIAQMVICPITKGRFAQVDSVREMGTDRSGGFGSTGK